MRTVTKEFIELVKNSDTAIGEILRMPPSDLTECKRNADEFAAWIKIEHEKDRKIIAEALAAAG